MVSQTNEKALEALMEKALFGISREMLQEQVGSTDAVALAQASQYRTEVGYGYQLGWSVEKYPCIPNWRCASWWPTPSFTRISACLAPAR
jgi:hypothetical protein